MRILIICSGKPSNPNWNFKIHRSFVYEQAESLKKLDVEYNTYFIEGNGIFGYLKNYSKMIKKIKKYKPDLIHAHYGLSGLLANLQRKTPVITTYHGDDINEVQNLPFSYICSKLSKENIFVHDVLPKKIHYRKNTHLIPCGVNTEIFYPIDKQEARKQLGLEKNKIYGLFGSSFDEPVKNYSLAKESISKSSFSIELLELKGYKREEVSLLMNAIDFLIVTSHSETGPLVVKEAMCCNTPIVSVDVGDVKDLISDIDGCYIAPYCSSTIAKSIDEVVEKKQRINSRTKILEYSLENIAKRVFNIYYEVLNRRNK